MHAHHICKPVVQSCDPTYNRFLVAAQTIQSQAQQNVRHSCKKKKNTLGRKFPIFSHAQHTCFLSCSLSLSPLPVASALFVLAQVGEPSSYLRESWLMEKNEKMQIVPTLHHQGNILVQEKCYREASEKYKEAVLLLRTVQSRVMCPWVSWLHVIVGSQGECF